MKVIKKTIFLAILILAGSFCYSKNYFSNLKLTGSYTNAFNIYNMNKYSKNSIGVNLGYEYSLFENEIKSVQAGVYGRAGVQNFVPYNNQLLSLYSWSFSGGGFAQWVLKNDYFIQTGIGAGFLISQIDFVSAEKGAVNDVYYDFMIEADLNLRKSILKNKSINVLANCGCHAAFYNEKTKNFMNAGPVFGLAFDFGAAE